MFLVEKTVYYSKKRSKKPKFDVRIEFESVFVHFFKEKPSKKSVFFITLFFETERETPPLIHLPKIPIEKIERGILYF